MCDIQICNMYMCQEKAVEEVKELKSDLSIALNKVACLKSQLAKCVLCGIRQIHHYHQCQWEEGQESFQFDTDTVSKTFLKFSYIWQKSQN